MLVRPPTNHLANGSLHSRALSHFSNQCRLSACFSQNAGGSAAASAYRRSYSSKLFTWAFAANFSRGWNRRCSLRIDSMDADSDISLEYRISLFDARIAVHLTLWNWPATV